MLSWTELRRRPQTNQARLVNRPAYPVPTRTWKQTGQVQAPRCDQRRRARNRHSHCHRSGLSRFALLHDAVLSDLSDILLQTWKTTFLRLSYQFKMSSLYGIHNTSSVMISRFTFRNPDPQDHFQPHRPLPCAPFFLTRPVPACEHIPCHGTAAGIPRP